MKRWIAFLLALALLSCALPAALAAETLPLPMELAEAVDGVSAYLIGRMRESGVYSDWSILQLARSGNLPGEMREDYLRTVEQRLQGGVLDGEFYTAYSRTALALTACGADATDFAGCNVLAPLGNYDKTVEQGINGAIYALLAIDCGGYALPADSDNSRERLLSAILAAELPDGGWAQGGVPDVDLTAMALQALAPYRERSEIGAAIERGLTVLSALQQPDGGYVSQWGERSSESPAQVLLALCALGIDPAQDARFVQENGAWLGSAIFGFLADGDAVAFGHSNNRANYLATEQVGYTLVAYARFLAGESFLYDMRDVLPERPSEEPSESKDNPYTDIDGHWAREQILTVTELGLMNGVTTSAFAPETTLDRAMLVTILYRAAGKPEVGACGFSDVPADSWYTDAIAWAQGNRIVEGVGDNRFAPEMPITREQLATILWRYCGKQDAATLPEGYVDRTDISPWAAPAMAWAVENGIVNGVEGNRLAPLGEASRAQAAVMFCRLAAAELL